LSTPKSLGNLKKRVTLEGRRALAALLGSVACRENNWPDSSNNSASIAGSVCTEFSMFYTSESFATDSQLGSIRVTDYSGAKVVTDQSIKRKSTIKSMSTVNKRLTSDFTSNMFELSEEEKV